MELGVGRYEVTVSEWGKCERAGACSRKHQPVEIAKSAGKAPVGNITWDEAKQYVAWLSKKTGERYRLLSEAEWEYAARAGSRGKYYWGDSENGICQYASVFVNQAAGCDVGKISEVGQRKPNAFGLYDMSGNAYEWTEDCWNSNYRGAPVDGSAWLSGGLLKSRDTRRLLEKRYGSGAIRRARIKSFKFLEPRLWISSCAVIEVTRKPYR